MTDNKLIRTSGYLQQYREHTGFIEGTKSFAIKIGKNLMDVFPHTTNGWPVPTRFRLIKDTWVYQHGPRMEFPKP